LRRATLPVTIGLVTGSWKLEAGMVETMDFPGPADVAYFTQAQASGWGDMLRSFVKFLAPPPGARGLDIGTGPGLLPRLLVKTGARLAVGCDDAPAMLRRAAELAGNEAGSGRPVWARADALHLPFARESFDFAVATNLLFLLADPGAGLAQLVHVTRPGGVVTFANPDEAMSVAAAEAFADRRGLTGFDRFSFVNYGRLAEAHHRLSAPDWVALATSAGLTDVRTETRAEGLVVFVRGLKQAGA